MSREKLRQSQLAGGTGNRLEPFPPKYWHSMETVQRGCDDLLQVIIVSCLEMVMGFQLSSPNPPPSSLMFFSSSKHELVTKCSPTLGRLKTSEWPKKLSENSYLPNNWVISGQPITTKSFDLNRV